jgi:nitrate reductase assembly molybdenum cofactor insertion protein NarJ
VTPPESEVAVLLAHATEWRLLSLLLSRPRASWRAELGALTREVADPLLRRAAEEAEGAGEGAYHALLGPGGPASPREAAHVGFGDPGRVLADLAARYAAFGFATDGEDPDDHLAVECGFVSYLFLKEAYALFAGGAANAEVARDARARLLSEHVAVAGRGFAARLPEGAPPYLRAVADALVARLPAAAPAPEGPAEDEPLACGCPGMDASRA